MGTTSGWSSAIRNNFRSGPTGFLCASVRFVRRWAAIFGVASVFLPAATAQASNPSDPPVARQSEPGPPGALQNVSATPEDGGVALRWSAPADNGGSTILRYEVRSAEGASVPEGTPWIRTGTFTSFAFPQLTNGTRYSFEVRAVNAQGAGPAAQLQATPGLPPSAPQSLTATADDSGVVLRWSAPANDGGLAILRYEVRSAEGTSVPEGTPWISNGTLTSRAFPQLTNGTRYSFEVRAVSARGEGGAARIQATPGQPSAPQSLTATPEDSAVVLRWSAPADEGSSRVLHYQIRYAEGASVPEDRPWSWAGSTTAVVFRSLTNGVLYSFEVRAVNAQGEGPVAQIQATPGRPSAPQSLTATPEDGAVVLRWSAPAHDGGSRILHYQMRRAEGASVPEDRPWISTGIATTGAFRQLTNGVLYSFEVRAVNAQGEGTVAQIQATPGFPPSAPRNLTAKASHGQVTLEWEAPAAPGSTAITDYEYRYAEGAAVPSETAWRSNGRDPSRIVDDLTSGTAYAFEVRAVNGVGVGDAATATATPVRHPTVTARPEKAAYRFAEGASGASVAIVAQGEQGGDRPSAAFRMAVITSAVTGGATLSADVENLSIMFDVEPEDYSEVDGIWQARKSVALSIVDDSAVEADEEFQMNVLAAPGVPPWVRFREADGTTACASGGCVMTVTIEDNDGPLSAPQDVSATTEDGGVVLRWSAPRNSGGSNVRYYEMRNAEGASVPASTRWISTGPSTTGAFRFLTNGTLYSFEVRAVNADGEGPAAQIQATPGFPPSAPRNLTAAARHGGVRLDWEAPSDSGSTAIDRYEYRYAEGATVPSETAWQSIANVLFRGVSGLTNGTAYAFEVRAANAVGAGAAATATATPVRHPTVTARPEKAAYNFVEGASETSVAIVAEVESDGGRPSEDFYVSVSTKEVTGGAKSPADYGAVAAPVGIEPKDFSKVGGVWQARKTVALSIVDDALDEDDENLTVTLEMAPGFPPWAQIREADGTTVCGSGVCLMTVTIGDNDSAPSEPQNFTATPEDGEVTLAWEAPADSGTSAISEYEYRHAEGTSVPEKRDWISAGTDLTATIGSLTEGTTYAFEVRAVSDAGGGAPASATAGPLTVPSVPQDVVAAAEDGGIVLRWSAPADDGGSNVRHYQMRNAEGASVPASTRWTSTGPSTTGAFRFLTNGTLYSFEVRAVNAQGDGPAAQIQATPGFPPSAPRNLTATASHGAVTLEWEAPSDSGSTAIDRYEYRYAEGATVPSGTVWEASGRNLSRRVSGLTNGTAYAFEVRAANAVGAGAAATATATPVRHPTVTARPEMAAYSFVEGASETSVAIVAEVESGGGRPSEVFEVSVSTKTVTGGAKFGADYATLSITVRIEPEDFSEVGGIWQARKTVALSIVDDALDEDDENLSVRLIRAPRFPPWAQIREADGTTVCGADGCLMTVTIGDNDSAPSAPQNLSATPGDGEVTLAWEAPADPGTSAISEYEYRHAEGTSVPAERDWISAGTDLTATIGSLTEGTTYAFEVRAVSDAGGGAPASATAGPLTLPSVPQEVVAAAEDGGIVLRWSAPADDGGSNIRHYQMRNAEGASVPASTRWISTGLRTTGAFRFLTNGTLYSFEVRAVNAQGDGPAAQIQATPGLPPSAPRNLMATPADGGVELRWQAPADDGGADIARYDVRHAEGASVPGDTTWTPVGLVTTLTVSDLTNGTAYAFEVRAVSNATAGEAATTAATPATVPGPPQNFSTTPGDGEVVLTWQAPASNGGSAVTEYEYRHAEGEAVPDETAWQSAGTTLTATIDSLTNDTAYAFEVRAVNAEGEGEAATAAATAAVQPTVPSVPQSFAATPGDGEVVLTWQAPASNGGSAVTEYEYRHAEGASVPDETAWQSAGTSLTATVDSLTNGTEYAFEVRAVNAEGESDPAAATATPATVPGPPQNLSTTPASGEVTLTWKVPSSNGGSAVIDYEYRLAEGASVPAEAAWLSTGKRTHVTRRGLTNGTEYTFEVRAVNVVGGSEPATATTTPAVQATVPSVPQSFAATPGDGEVVLTWQAPASDGGSAVTEYEHRYAEGEAVPDETAWQSAGTSLTATVDSLTNGTTYAFEVRAVNAEGEGEAAAMSATPATVPGLPQSLAATPRDGEVVLTWQAPASNGGSAVTEYEYRHAEGASVPDETAWQSAGTSLTVTVDSLTNGTEYAFEVRAVNNEGESEASAMSATPATVPGLPQSLAATPGDGEVVLTWQAPASNGGSAVTEYEYRHAEGASVPDETAWQSAGTSLTATVDNLTNGTEYSFEVRAVNAEGEGDAATATATPAVQPTVPSVPQSLVATPGDGEVVLTWQAPASNGGSAVTEYEYRHAEGASVPDETAWQSAGTSLTATIDSLTNGTAYAFEVRAVNAEGEGEASAMSATPATVPGLPQNFSTTPGDGEVVLTWQAPASNGGSAVTEYEYRHAEGASVPDETAWQSAGTSLTATVDSLTNDTAYAFEVRAVNAVGEGEAATVTGTPREQATAPSAPRNLAAMPGDGEAILTWQVPASDGGSPILGYAYRYAEGASVPPTQTWRSIDSVLTVMVGSLTNGAEYTFEVRAVNAEGEGEASATSATPSANPVVTVHPAQAAYRFAEDASGPEVAIVARTGPDARKPSETFHVSVSTQAVSDGATSPDDFAALSEIIAFEPGDFSAAGRAWEARKTIPLAIVDDGADEGDESFNMVLQSTLGSPRWVQLRDADDTGACGFGGCVMAVTIEDDDRAASAPQNLTATPGDEQVTLAWEAPADPGSSEVSGYEYRHAEGATVPSETTWQSAGMSLTAMIDSLTNDTGYAFEVRAVSDAGEGDAATATATPAVQPTVPSVPQSFAATAGDGEVVLTWQAPANNGGSAVTEYEYRHAEGTSVPDETAWQSAGTGLTATVDSLTNGTEYAFEVRAVNAEGEGDAATATATPAVQATVPSVPQSLAATPGDGEVLLTWQAPASNGGSAITEYEYRHAEGEAVPDETAWQSAGTSLTATVDSLTNGTEYAFEVRAVNNEGEGEAATVTVTPAVQPTVPSVPQNLAATPGDGEVVLTWQAPASNGGSAVTEYEYRHAEGASVPDETAWQSAGTSLTATVDSLTNGTEYAFEVRAVNAEGEGEAATAAATPAVQPTVPSVPQSFAATPGDGEVVLTWQAPASNGGSAVTEYEYRHAEGASVPDETAWQSAGTSLTATAGSLTNGTEYAFEVRAVNAEGEGEAATAAATPAVQPTVPSVPQNLAATPGDGEVVLTWQAPASNGGSAVTGYEYRHAEGEAVPDETAWQSAGTSLTATVDSLTNGTEYAFEVRAVNDEGEGKPATVTVTPAVQPTVPSVPQSLAATPGDGEVVLTWQAPASNGGSAITEYEYRHAEGASVPDETAWQSAGTSLTATVDNLTNGTEYAFEVRAVNAEGESKAAMATVTPAVQPTVPSVPQSFAATPGDGEVVLAWAAPADDGGSAVTEYEYRHAAGSSVPDVTGWTSAGTALTVTVGGLTNGAEYAFEVRAVNDVGASEPASATTTAVAAPDLPRNLAATPGDGEVVLAWEAPASNGGSAITRYEYRYAEGASVPDTTGWTSVDLVLTITVGGLTNGAEYAFEVRAVNDVGASEPASTTATPVTVPGAPKNLSAVPGDGEVTISWEPPESDGGAPIVEYQYRYAEGDTVPDETLWESAGADLTRTVDGLADGQEHTFQVRAVNRVGPGALSEATTTVLKLPILSVEDGRAEERSDPAVDFNVLLSRSSTRTVSVNYTTADRSAKAGEDYERTEGTLVFAAGEVEKTVSVPLLRDAKDEGEETFAFLLSDAQNARIGRAGATGVISNDGDALPGAWLVRFGRTIAQQIVEAVGTRLGEEPRRHATVGGVSMLDATADVRLETTYISAAERLQLPSDEQRARHNRSSGLPPGTSFHLSSSEPGDGPVFSLWGRGAADRFDAQVEDVRMDGDVTTGLIAADSDWGRMTLGAAIAHSQGRGTFAYTGPRASPQARGKVRSLMMGIYPYARLRVDDTASLWGLAGAGAGYFTLTEEAGAPIRTDIDLTLGALGAVKTLVAAPDTDGFALSLKSDAFWVRTSSKAVRSAANGNLAASEGEVTRMRLALEGERPFSDGEGRSFVPKLSVGVRHDGGDAETGFGLEVGGGIGWTDAARGISAELNARRLVSHEARGFRDWGMSGSVRFDPAPSSERGLALSLTSSAGAAANRGTDSLFAATSVTELSRRNAPDSSGRITAEAGYGLPALGGRLTGVPYVGIGLSGSGRDYTLGWRTRRKAPSGHGELGFSISATRSQYERGDTGYGAAVTLSLRW